MRGHIRQRSPGRWAIILDIFKDGTRKRKWHSFKGTKREAQDQCAKLVAAMAQGTYVETSKLTVGQHLLDRLSQRETKIGHKTAERYRQLIVNQIIPHLATSSYRNLKPSISSAGTTPSRPLVARTAAAASVPGRSDTPIAFCPRR